LVLGSDDQASLSTLLLPKKCKKRFLPAVTLCRDYRTQQLFKIKFQSNVRINIRGSMGIAMPEPKQYDNAELWWFASKHYGYGWGNGKPSASTAYAAPAHGAVMMKDKAREFSCLFLYSIEIYEFFIFRSNNHFEKASILPGNNYDSLWAA
jgi:hypothetical protein